MSRRCCRAPCPAWNARRSRIAANSAKAGTVMSGPSGIRKQRRVACHAIFRLVRYGLSDFRCRSPASDMDESLGAGRPPVTTRPVAAFRKLIQCCRPPQHVSRHRSALTAYCAHGSPPIGHHFRPRRPFLNHQYSSLRTGFRKTSAKSSQMAPALKPLYRAPNLRGRYGCIGIEHAHDP